jgi:hypothetical protein
VACIFCRFGVAVVVSAERRLLLETSVLHLLLRVPSCIVQVEFCIALRHALPALGRVIDRSLVFLRASQSLVYPARAVPPVVVSTWIDQHFP